jgi:hypothetical protein
MRTAAAAGVATLLFIAVAGGAGRAVADPPSQVAIYESLSRDHLLFTRFDAVLKSVLDVLMSASDVPLQPRLNQPYEPGSLNIYVVDRRDAASPTLANADGRVRDMLRYVNDNALAFPPDLIVFDAGLLADYLVNAWNVELATAQAVDAANAREAIGAPHERAFDVVQTYGVLADVYRFNNLRRERTDPQERARRIALAGTLVDGAASSGAANMFLFALAPILYHELGHVVQGNAGSFLDFIADIARELASPRILARENAADDFAGQQLRRLVAAAQSAPAETMPDKLSRYESMASTVLLMRDSVLLDVFEGFRGLSAEDHFLNLVHEDCRRKPWTAELGFYDPRKIAVAGRFYVPFLTADEFAQLRRKALATMGAGTHAHNFVRGSRLMTAVDSLFGLGSDDSFMTWYTRFLEAMQKNDPALLADPAVEREEGLGLNLSWLAGTFGLKVLPVVTCPPRLCRIGTFVDGRPGFVEITGPTDNLTSLRLVYPLFRADPSGAIEEARAGPTSGSVNLLRRFIAGTLGYPDAGPAGVGSLVPFDELLPMARKCRAVAFAAVHSGRSFVLSTLNPEFWVSVEVRRPQ